MGYHHFTILFVIIFAVLFLKIQMVVTGQEKRTETYMQAEQSFYTAADMAGEALCRYGTSGIITDKDAAYNNFLYYMYATLGIMDQPAAREEFLRYIPMFAVLDEEGYYIRFTDEYEKADGFCYTTGNWTECMPYCYSDDDFIYWFTLDDTVYLYDKTGVLEDSGRLYHVTLDELLTSSRFDTLRNLRPESFLFDEQLFLKVKQTAIVTSVQDAMRYYVNHHNSVVGKYGITFEFALPVMDNSVWSRSIEHPGVLIMIQGYPLDAANEIYYSCYTFVGAQLYKRIPYFLTEKDWYVLYHRSDCSLLNTADETVIWYPYYSVEECVKKGAYACEQCIPDGMHPPDTVYCQ